MSQSKDRSQSYRLRCAGMDAAGKRVQVRCQHAAGNRFGQIVIRAGIQRVGNHTGVIQSRKNKNWDSLFNFELVLIQRS